MDITPEQLNNKTNRKKKILQIIGIVFIIILIYKVGFNNGKKYNENIIDKNISIEDAIFINKNINSDNKINFSLFWDVWDLLKEKYVNSKELDANKLFYGAIKGMLAATEDPYTTFFDPNENKKFEEDISGNFEGIGAELGIKNSILTIIAPLPQSPAEKAGLRSGDKIIKIDGKTSSDMTIEEAVDNIRGKKLTKVVLTIFRDGNNDTQEINIERNIINVKSVTLELKENNIGYIKISRFGDDTVKSFSDALKTSQNKKVSGLILDLRNNPGGYLDASIDMASKMLPKNKVVVIEEDGNGTQQKMYTRGGDISSQIKTVVLINEGSASASEILAGALKENRDNITIVGKKSFGKGSVQELIPLSKNTAVKITVAKWLTPNGNQINEQGINPDEEINLSEDDYNNNNNKDPQLDKALDIIKNTK